MKIIKFIKNSVIKTFKTFKPLFDAVDAALLGPKKSTEEAPHLIDRIDFKRYMGFVLIALIPSAAASVYFFGLHALLMIMVSYAAGGMVEVAFAIIRKHEVEEGFFVTGLIFPLILPPTTPLWVVAVGVAFGTLFGKEVFGGTGRNIFNPALVGRLFITIAFPTIMTTFGTDAVTGATPLALYKSSQILTPYMDLLFGWKAGVSAEAIRSNLIPGSMGETFRLGIILGGLLLIFSKVSNWRIPFSYLISVLLFSLLGHNFIPEKIAPPLFHLLSGGLLYGAFFMATDPVTSPFTHAGKYIFGFFCGFFTVLIRVFSGFPEGVMFSIVLMNAFVPLIDHLVLSSKYKVKNK